MVLVYENDEKKTRTHIDMRKIVVGVTRHRTEGVLVCRLYIAMLSHPIIEKLLMYKYQVFVLFSRESLQPPLPSLPLPSIITPAA